MTSRLFPLIVALAIVGCRAQDQAQRSKPNYQVVAEGSANGVTSTMNGPGETSALVTDTNADTTTNFTLPTNPNPLGNETAGTTFDALPAAPAYAGSATTSAVQPSHPLTDTRGMASATAPAVITDTIGSTPRPMPPETRARAQSETETNTTTDSSETATTDTSAPTPTTTASQPDTPPSPKKKKEDGKKPEDQQQPPPPPPATDTIGDRG
jgi:hypothetical protein